MNHFCTLLLAASCLTAVGQVPDYVPNDGLVGWFDMEGELLNELSGELGTLTNTSSTSDRYGNEGLAIEFSGNAYGATSGSNMPTGALSVASWILPQTSWSQGAGIEFLCLGTSGSTKWGAIVGSEFTHLNRGRGCQGSGVELQNSGIELNQWNHVVFSCAGPGLATEVYLNGSLIGLSQNISAGSGCSASNLYFGVDIFSQPEYITGALDDIGIWNRAITMEEVLALYNAAAPVTGCTDVGACNYDLEAVVDDGFCLYADDCGECGGTSIAGCIDDQACNFDAVATCDNGSCDYSCCPGPGCCLDGQHWDWDLSGCVITNPADINLDGCVQLNDLLDLLSAYGNCSAEESTWQCGDPLEYQGYDYETVQIGEQCWFAENLRAENYLNGDVIPMVTENEEWLGTMQGARCWHDNDSTSWDFPGFLYNGYAVEDSRLLCPQSWHVGTDLDWAEVEICHGLEQDEAYEDGQRGGNINLSQKMRDQSWGLDVLGFGVLPGGYRSWQNGNFSGEIQSGAFWSNGSEWHGYREFHGPWVGVARGEIGISEGLSVRCIKDTV